MTHTHYDVVIVGGGHNGLVAASYLAKAGKTVLLLERNNYIGGATTSQRIFSDYDAHLSRYSYLVSLFPEKISQDLDLSVEFRRRKIASFTPFERDGKADGILLTNIDEDHNQQVIENLNPKDYETYRQMLDLQQVLADKIWDSFLEPLQSKNYWENQFSEPTQMSIWKGLIDKPIGQWIEMYAQNDLLRGILLTDAKIGAYTHAHDPSLLQNRTYLYHVIGNKTGEWRVPLGGLGAEVDALQKVATKYGTTLLTNANVCSLQLGDEYHQVGFDYENSPQKVNAKYVLLNASPLTTSRLLNEPYRPTPQDEGTAFKVNMLLERLPQLKAEVASEDAFAGTFHINQSYSQMEQAYKEAAAGKVPSLPPCEIYCHTLTDDSILSTELVQQGYHTLTLFGLDMPYRLFKENPEATKKQVLAAYFQGINSYLAEPIEDCIARAADGTLCVEAKSAWDLEQELGLPQGNIFHKGLSWFFAENDAEIGSRGVETAYNRVYVCGSSAKRGGAVSGITGYNAAMKVLETT